jgi:phospholipase A-2-activating protein
MWKSQEQTWEELGEVVDPNAGADTEMQDTIQTSATKHYAGDALFPAGDYDHIFDVEIGDGIMRKLPFNNGASFLEASDKFCAREGMSRHNVEQIVQFLRTNAKSFRTRDFDGAEAKQKQQDSKFGPKAPGIPFTQLIFFDQVNFGVQQRP